MTSNIVPQGLFGPGILYVTRNDIAAQTPYNVGFCNEFSYDLKGTVKQLFGQNTFPLLAAKGTTKCSGTIKAATMSGQVLNSVFFGGTFTTAVQWDVQSTASTAIPTTPFQITPVVPNSGTFGYDLGVINAATSEPFTLVTGTPGAGQYKVAAGVYTFSSADNVSGISVIISYAYNWTTGPAPGQNLIMTNTPLGQSPTFQLDYKTTLFGATYMITFYNAIATGWKMAHKLEDFAMPEFDVELFVNASQQLGRISLATQA